MLSEPTTPRKEETLAPICCKQQRKGVQGLQGKAYASISLIQA